jgi:hypothetical protein
MGYERSSEDDQSPQTKKTEFGIQSPVDSPAPKSADKVSVQAEKSKAAFRKKAKAGSTPGSEYWLP